MRLLGISGTVTGSKTCTVVKKVLEEAQKYAPEVEVELLDLKDYDIQFCDGRQTSNYNDDTKKVIDIISSADLYLIGTPIFQASLTGALKNLFDLVSPEVFRHKVMGFVAKGGTFQHYLVIENQLKPIAGYFRAFVAPSSVYVHQEHFDNNELADMDILNRKKKLAKELVCMQVGLIPEFKKLI